MPTLFIHGKADLRPEGLGTFCLNGSARLRAASRTAIGGPGAFRLGRGYVLRSARKSARRHGPRRTFCGCAFFVICRRGL